MKHVFMAALTLICICALHAPAEAQAKHRACSAQDVAGGWQLVKVSGTKGPGTKTRKQARAYLKANPGQYMYLSSNQLVARVDAKQLLKAPELQKSLQNALSRSREQYVLDDKSRMFLYVNRQPTDSYQCDVPRGKAGVAASMRLTQQVKDKTVHYSYHRVAITLREKADAKKTDTKSKKKS